MKLQIESIGALYDQYASVLQVAKHDPTLDELKTEYISVVSFALNNMNHVIVHPKQFWKFINQRRENRAWENIIILIELCWCAPFTNAHLERFFSQMKVVKTDWRNKLNAENLTHLLRIKVEGPEFREKYCSIAVDCWFNDKDRRLHEGKRKSYKRKENATEKCLKLNFELPSIFNTSSESEEDCDI